MGNPEGDAQGCLPVSCQLVVPEVEAPAGYPVDLAHHAFTVLLPCHADRLFQGGILPPVAEHIHTRNAKLLHGTHTFPDRQGLGMQRPFVEHMPGQVDPMLFAPLADLIPECPRRTAPSHGSDNGNAPGNRLRPPFRRKPPADVPTGNTRIFPGRSYQNHPCMPSGSVPCQRASSASPCGWSGVHR